MKLQPASVGLGKYDTYKGSTRSFYISPLLFLYIGKYDTYKGSTQDKLDVRYTNYQGNMILIKDRHFSPLYKFTYALFGKYDPYKGSTQSNANPFQDSSSGKYDIDKG